MDQLNGPLWALLGAGLAGCVAAPMASSRFQAASYSIRAAEEAGARHSPAPARLLEEARRELMQARNAADNGDPAATDLLLECAQTDAELSRQLLRTLDERQKAKQAWASASSGAADRSRPTPRRGEP